MVEVVQTRMEGMNEEHEEMRRTKLFSSQEIAKLINTRRDFEYKLHSCSKRLQVYLDYIEHEKKILKSIRLRREKSGYGGKKNSIEYKVVKRMKDLYEVAVKSYPSDFSLLSAYLQFCKRSNFISVGTETVAVMTQSHPNDVHVWQIAANWHAQECKDKAAACRMLLKGLSFNSDSIVLYKQLIDLELLETEEKEASMGQELTESQKTSVAKLKVTVEQILRDIKNCSFLIEILDTLQPYEYTFSIQEIIIDHLIKDYSDREIVWHTLAQREKKGVIRVGTVEERHKTNPKERLKGCFSKYREGLATIPPSNKPNLWKLCLDSTIEVYKDNLAPAKNYTQKQLLQLLSDADEENCLSEEHYLTWFTLLESTEVLKKAEKATRQFPQSPDLWRARLKYEIITAENFESESGNAEKRVNQVFKQGVEVLKEEALPLWLDILKYHLLTSSDQTVESIFADAIEQPEPISKVMKVQYIEWVAVTKDMASTRLLYNNLVEKRPYCKELHQSMAKLEAMQLDPDYGEWEKVHKLACKQFPKDVEVWMDYLDFHVSFKQDKNVREIIETVHKQALKELPSDSIPEYYEKYNTFKENLGKM